MMEKTITMHIIAYVIMVFSIISGIRGLATATSKKFFYIGAFIMHMTLAAGTKILMFIIRRMDTRDFSRERKCAGINDASTEYIQAECIFFAFLPVFCQKVLSAKIPF